MGWNNHVDFELSDALQELIKDGLLKEGTAAFGITRQVIEGGTSTLSPKQSFVYKTEVEPLLAKKRPPS
jgi:hypothetical protein